MAKLGSQSSGWSEQPFLGTLVPWYKAYFVNSVLRLNYNDLRLETHGIALLTLQEASGSPAVEQSNTWPSAYFLSIGQNSI